jgi:hypothetical protein
MVRNLSTVALFLAVVVVTDGLAPSRSYAHRSGRQTKSTAGLSSNRLLLHSHSHYGEFLLELYLLYHFHMFVSLASL